MADERLELEKLPAPDEAPAARSESRAGFYPASYSYGYGYSSEEDENNLRKLWRTVRKRKWMIATIAVIVTTVVTVQVHRIKSTYQASAIIEIGKDNTNMVKSGDLIVQEDWSDMYVPQVAIKTKILALRSRPLLEEVAERLKLDENPRFLDVYQKRSFLDALESLAGKEKKEAASSASSAEVELQPATPERRAEADEERLLPYVGALSAYLNVEQVRDTRALKISFTHTEPKMAAAVANGVAEVFIESNFRNKTQKFTNTSEWLERSTRELKARVEQAEQSLANYTRENNIFSTQNSDTLTTDKLSRLHDQATRAETERMLKHSLYEEVKAGRVAQLPEAFADPKTAELQKKAGELAVLAAQLGVKFGPENPKVVEVKEQVAAIEDQIRASRQGLEEKLKADYERAVRDEASLKAALATAKAEAVQQNQAAIQFNILKQEVDTAKSLYTDFLQKTNQAKVQLAEQQNNLRLIEPASVPGGPVGPQRFRSIMIALFLSLAAGVGLAFFLDYLDNTIKTVDDVNRFAQLPALSVIPVIAASAPRKLAAKNRAAENRAAKKRAAELPAGSSPRAVAPFQPIASQLPALDTRSSAAEAYRVLRTSVLLSTAGSPPKIILVTSGQPGEGKTTTAVNTAISLAQLGASVLLIDCDLRRPSTHKVFGIDHSRGLSTYLARGVDLSELIQPLQIPNLSVLPCGPIPPNPAELISSDKMRQMLRGLSERYDHILIDSPPLINVTDPVILSTLVDGVILVVHGGKSTRDVVRRARQELTAVGAKIFGVVLNNVDLRREGYDDYYYYRYYSSYGQEKESSASG
jgi:capsular exopolysaccharide synthesis family protein